MYVYVHVYVCVTLELNLASSCPFSKCIYSMMDNPWINRQPEGGLGTGAGVRKRSDPSAASIQVKQVGVVKFHSNHRNYRNQPNPTTPSKTSPQPPPGCGGSTIAAIRGTKKKKKKSLHFPLLLSCIVLHLRRREPWAAQYDTGITSK